MPWSLGSVATWFSGQGAIAAGSTYLGAALANSSGYEMVRLTLGGTLNAAPAAAGGISFWLLRDNDGAGTAYEDGSTGAPGTVPFRSADYFFPCGGSQVTYSMSCDITFYPGHVAPLVRNDTGAAMNASWTLKALPYNP